MCSPVALGVASFASSAAGAIGAHQSAQAQADAANEAAINNYKYQIAVRENKWRQTLTIWNQKRIQYKKGLAENALALNRGDVQVQDSLNRAYQQAKLQGSADTIDLLKKQGVFQARGTNQGQSSDKIERSILAEYGLKNAMRANSLAMSRMQAYEAGNDLRRKAESDLNNMYSKVALQPVQGVAPVVPTMQPGPSPLSLIAGLGQAALGGLSTYKEFGGDMDKIFKNNNKPAPKAAPPSSNPKSFTPQSNFIYDSNATMFSQSYA